MNELPQVALIIAAYNEAPVIGDKVANCLALNYPKDKLKIIFVTDGSDDGTPELLKQCTEVAVFHRPERKGKLAAVQRIIKLIHSPIVILTDANCMLNTDAVKNIVRHYENPMVGAVAGEKKIRKQRTGSTAGEGEGLYWRYESWLKKIDSDLNSVIGAAGELFSFRTELFESLPSDTIIEDFVHSMRIAMKGFRVVYEPHAFAMEEPSASLAEEWKRKVRICAGAFQSFHYLPGIWNPLRYGWLSIQFLSHRFLRWAVVPFLLPWLLIGTGVLATQSEFYEILLAFELAFMLLGLYGFAMADRLKLPIYVLLPTYLLMMNAAAYAGLYRYWNGQQSAMWEKATRQRQTQ
jgi:poly-beta-1,6-N-acetyl-D-glucosamine synthase